MPAYFASQTFTVPIVAGFTLYWADDLKLADLNGDGKTDIVASYHALNNVTLPLRLLGGNGAGGFTEMGAQVFGAAPQVVMANQLITADFNRDGRLDIFGADSGYDVSPWPGYRDLLMVSNGASALVPGSLPALSDMGHSAAAGDIDGDGDLDIYVGNIHGQADVGPYFLINNGAGAFTADTTRLPAAVARMQGEVYTSSVLADFNGDGRADLFLGSIGLDGAKPQIVWNGGAGQFSQRTLLPELSTTLTKTYTGAVASDIDGDGDMDLIAGLAIDNYNGGGLQILVNDGSGGFTDQTANRLIVTTALAPAGVKGFFRPQLFDMNADGHLDIVLNGYTNTPVLLNDGTGRFFAMPDSFLTRPAPATGTITYYPYPDGSPRPPPGVLVDHFAAGDVNGDGRGDLISARGTDYNTSEQYVVFLGVDPGASQIGTAAAEAFMGDDQAVSVLAGAGDDIIVGGAGQDFLRGEEGNDIITGGDAFDDTHGNMGNDTVYGGRGDDWVVGGKDQDQLFGDEGIDIVWGNLGADTCYGGADRDQVRGGQGDDVVYGDGGSDFISGDRGNDTVYGGAGADFFHGSQDQGIDRLMDFNRAEGDRVMLDPGTTYTVSQVGADTVIDTGNGNQMILVGVQLSTLTTGWIFESWTMD